MKVLKSSALEATKVSGFTKVVYESSREIHLVNESIPHLEIYIYFEDAGKVSPWYCNTSLGISATYAFKNLNQIRNFGRTK